MFRDFLRAIRTGDEPLMSLARAQRDLELVEAAYRTTPFIPELEAIP
jgi:predicted dehydrogenase